MNLKRLGTLMKGSSWQQLQNLYCFEDIEVITTVLVAARNTRLNGLSIYSVRDLGSNISIFRNLMKLQHGVREK